MVEPDSNAGRVALQALDRQNIPVDAAFWLLDENDQWKLYLHSPLIERKSRIQAYAAIQKALDGVPESIALQDINLLREDDELLKLLRVALSTGGTGIADIRFRNNWIDGVHIRDAVIYRL